MHLIPEIEHEIYRSPVERGSEPDVVRIAVRGVAISAGRILMVYSPVNGDCKFPGGGVEEGESHAEALVREVREETGLIAGGPFRCIARIREYGPAMEPDAEVFMMDSYYYRIQIDGALEGEQSLDEYEERLRFTPKWTTLAEALATNEALVASDRATPRWTPRETWMLKHLCNTGLLD